MSSYTGNLGRRRREDEPKVVCVWCGGVIRGASKARKRTCQPCFEQMMRDYSRAHQPQGSLPHASER